MSDRLLSSLREATSGMDVVGDVRGRGLVVAVDLVTSRETQKRNADLAARAVYRVWQLGGIVHYVGGNVLEVTPPLVIEDDEVDHAVDLLARGISEAASGRVTDTEIAPYAGW